jgi:hypothetical protein
MSNKSAKERLIQIYGAECFIDKLHLRTGAKEHYTSKGQRKRMEQLTYHHILEKRNGGKATVENGALLSAQNHNWFNKQSEEKQAEMNKKFQEYKNRSNYTEAKITLVDEIVIPCEVKTAEISFTEKSEPIIEVIDVYEGMTSEEITEYQEHKRKRNERIFKKFEEER